MKRKLVILSLILALVALPLAAACAKAPTPTPTPTPTPIPMPTPTPAPKPIVWEFLCWLSKDNVQNAHNMMFINKVNEDLKGKFQIKFVGGPEVISPYDIYKAVKAGVVEMGMPSSGYFKDILTHAAMYSNLTHNEIEETGYFELQDELHQTKGLKFIGESPSETPYYIFTNFLAEKLEDFEGKKIRCFSATIPIVEAVGATPVTMALGEVYTAMERGVIDGWTKGVVGVVPQYHWDEVTEYMILPGVYTARINIIANLDAWNELPEDVRNGIMKAYYDGIAERLDWVREKHQGKAMQEIKDSPIEIIQLPPTDAEKFSKRAYDLAWEELAKNNPEIAPVMKAMLVRF